MTGTSGADSIYGWDAANAAGDFGPESDADRMDAGSGNDLLSGGAGNDTLDYYGSGHSTLLGGSGDDLIFAYANTSLMIYGGAGNDVLSISFQKSLVAVNLAAPDAGVETVLASGTHVIGVERLAATGSNFGDALTGGQFADSLQGLEGNDTMIGGDGDDVLSGGRTYYSSNFGVSDWGRDALYGGGGDDDLYLVRDGSADIIDGGLGIDTVHYDRTGYEQGVERITVSASFVLPGGTVVTGVERIDYKGGSAADRVTGGAHDDTLSGSGLSDYFDGGAGNDYLTTGNYVGTVTLFGGAGDDVIYFGAATGDSLIFGGAGIDRISVPLWDVVADSSHGVTFSAAALAGGLTLHSGLVLRGFEAIYAKGTSHADSVTGGGFVDILLGEGGSDTLSGGAGNDELDGGDAADKLFGGGGNDSLYDNRGLNSLFGGIGNDFIKSQGAGQMQYQYGGAGDDTLIGGRMNDVINGGPGRDVLTGGGGADKFDFNTAPGPGEVDTITDFAAGVDKMALFARAFAGLSAGPLAMANFVLGTAALDASDRILYDAGTGGVWFDADGNGAGAAQLFALVTVGTAITAADFVIL